MSKKTGSTSEIVDIGEGGKEVIRPEVNRASMIDSQGAQITADPSFLLLREIDDCVNIILTMQAGLKDLRSPQHSKHSLIHMIPHNAHSIH